MIGKALKSRFVRDSAILQIGGVLTAIGNFLSGVMLAHILGATAQGIFYTAGALYSLFFFLLNLGAVQATTSQLAAASARGLNDKVAAWLAFLAKTYLAAFLVLFGLGYFLLPLIAELIYGEMRLEVSPHELALWAWLFTLTPLLEMPKVVVGAALQGTRRMLPLAQSENGMEAMRVFLVLTGAFITRSPLGPILGTLASSLLGSVLAIDMYRTARKDGGPPLPGVLDIARRIRSVPLREGLPLGVRIGVLRNIDALSIDVLPPLIIEYVGSSAYVAYYRIAQRIMRVPMMFMTGITRTALPTLSKFAATRDLEGFRRAYMRVTVLGGLLISTGILLCLPCVPLMLRWMYPEDYQEPVWNMAWILALGYLPLTFASAFDSFYIVTDQLRVSLKIALLGMVVHLPLAALLAWKIPVTGAAWGTVVSMSWALVHTGYILWYLHRGPGAPGKSLTPGRVAS